MLEDGVALGAPISVVAEAVIARFMSKATTREGKSVVWNGDVPADLIDNLEKALAIMSSCRIRTRIPTINDGC